jgi:hypothetical protein
VPIGGASEDDRFDGRPEIDPRLLRRIEKTAAKPTTDERLGPSRITFRPV